MKIESVRRETASNSSITWRGKQSFIQNKGRARKRKNFLFQQREGTYESLWRM